jgi:hypothetical protein
MLESVGHPHAVNPDRQLRKAALARGWPVLEFRRAIEGPAGADQAERAARACEQQLQ